jgi:hypothetical protein
MNNKLIYYTPFALLLLLLFSGCTQKEYLITPTQGYYGSDWNKLDGGFETVDLNTPDVYVRVKKLGAGLLNGFAVADGNLIPQHSGVYDLSVVASVGQTTGSSEYGMKVFVNDSNHPECYSHFHISNVAPTATPAIDCLIRLNAGDKINVRFDDHSSPVQDIVIDSLNLTAKWISR